MTHYFPSHRGGIEAVAGEIASRLAAAGEASITWYASATDTAPPDRPGLRCVPVRCCNVLERRFGLPLPLWSPFALPGLVRSVRASDAVHLHDFLYPGNIAAWAAARIARRPVLITQHVGMIPYRSRLLRALLACANRWLGARVLSGSQRVAFVSEAVRAYFCGFVRFSAPPLRVANGVDTRLFAPADEHRRTALRAGLGIRDGTPLLLFVGRFVEKKGLRLLGRLAQALPNAQWIFVGRGPLDPDAWRLANVRVRRDLSQSELVPLYQAADLLVLPSVGEGFPLVVQEAMACGTPALVSKATGAGAPEAAALLLTEALGQPGDSERWAARIGALLAAPRMLAELRGRTAEFARAEWSWEACARQYAEMLRCAQH